MRHHRSIYAAAALALATANVSHAVTRTWDGGAGSTNNFYDINTNWSGDVTPAATDDVIFSLAGTTSVLWDNITGNTTSKSLTTNNGVVAWSSFPSTGPFTHTVTGNVTVQNISTLRLNNFTLQTNGFFDILGGSTLEVSTGGVINAFNMSAFSGSTAMVNVINGGHINVSQSPILGEQNGAGGAVTISNANSSFMATKNLILGASGTTGKGTFTTTDNARVGIGNGGVAGAFAGGVSIWDSDLTGATGGNLLISNGSTFTHTAGGAFQIAGVSNTYGKVQVSGVGSSVSTTGELQVGFFGEGLLDLTGGGKATAQDFAAGIVPGATGTVTIGSASILQVNGNATLGDTGGTATETISAGGRMNVGNNSSGGTTLGLFLADTNLTGSGGGNLSIFAGNTLTHSSGVTARIGGPNSYGKLTVTGANAKWINNNGSGIALAVDPAAKGFLSVLAGGYAEAPNMTVGGFGGTGTVVVDGTSSTLKLLGNLDLSSTAGAGTGLVTASNGGTILVGDATFLNPGTDLMVTDASPIGTDGGVLSVRDGSKLTTSNLAFIGVFTGQAGRVSVSGTGSEWTGANQIAIGNGGDSGSRGELLVSNAGRVTAATNVGVDGTNSSINISSAGRLETTFQVVLASGSGANVSATVAGANSTIAVGTLLEVGRNGNATLNINTGGKVTANDAVVGTNANAVGSIVMNDAGSLLDIDHDLTVGNAAGGVDSIVQNGGLIRVGDAAGTSPVYIFDVSDSNLDGTNGGNVRFDNGSTYASNAIVSLGQAANTRGALTIAGGANFNTNSGIDVGNLGTGVLSIQSGGKLIANGNGVILSFNGPGTGTATIDGNGSILQTLTVLTLNHGSTLTTTSGGTILVGDNAAGFAADRMVIGDNDAPAANAGGKLTIASGSTLNHHSRVLLAPNANTFGSVLVTGTNSRWDIGGDLIMGNSGGTADLRIEAGGTVTAGIGVVDGLSGPGASTITVTGTNSTLAAVTTLEVGRSTSGTLNINAGGKTTAPAVFVGNAAATGIGTIDLTGTGSLLDVADTLTIGGAGTGTVNLSGGTLKAATVTRGASSTFNFTGGTLVTHTFTGQLTQNGGTLSPGNTGVRDVTSVSGGYALNTGTLEADLFATNNDVITSSGPVSLAGNLSLNNVSFPTTIGTSRILIDAPSLTGHFATVTGFMLTPTRFVAVTYSPTGALVTVALPGDATLTNGVEFNDLVALAQNYNGTGKVWAQGDFDGNGNVNFNDLVLLAQNYNHTSLDDLSAAGFSPAFAGDWALAQSMVPEPGVVALIGIAGALRLRRRR